MNNEEVIAHHGVRGQKWGIRRYQYSDGSLTPAGRRKAQKLKEDYKSLTGKKLKGKIPKESPEGKPVKKLNDTELSDRINRLRKEKEALALEKDLSSNGSKFVRTVGSQVIAPAAISAGKSLLEKKLMEWGSSALGLNKKEVKSTYEKLKEEANISDLKRKIADNKRWLNDEAAGLHDTKRQKESKQNQNKKSESKDNNKSSDNNSTYNFNFFANEKKYNEYRDAGKKVYDAVYEEKSSTNIYDQALLEDKRKGQKLLGFYGR